MWVLSGGTKTDEQLYVTFSSLFPSHHIDSDSKHAFHFSVHFLSIVFFSVDSVSVISISHLWSQAKNKYVVLKTRFYLQRGQTLTEADFYSSSRPQCSGEKMWQLARWSPCGSQQPPVIKTLCGCRCSESGHYKQPAVSHPEGVRTGGQCEGVVWLPPHPPAPSHHLCHPQLQPRWVKFRFPTRGGRILWSLMQR